MGLQELPFGREVRKRSINIWCWKGLAWRLLADVKNQENTDNIKASVAKQIEKDILENSLIFHLRGGIDYSKLNFKHKTMMKMLYHALKNKPVENLTQEDKALIETYNKKVDFVDYHSLKQIVEAIQ